MYLKYGAFLWFCIVHSTFAQEPRSAEEIFGTTKNDYVAFAPKVFRPGTPFRISVIIFNPDWIESKFTFELVDATDIALTRVEQFYEPGTLTVTDLAIPTVLDPGIYYDLKLTVVGPKVSYDILEKRRLLLSRNTASLFIQLDRPLYRGDDIVSIRVIAVLPDLTSFKGLVNIFIEDSRKHRIVQWLDQSVGVGLISKEFALGSHPISGKWSVHAFIKGEREIIKPFDISDDQLPIFEIKIDIVPFQVVGKDVSGVIEAIYKFGEPVHSTGHIKVSFENNPECSLKTYEQDIALPEGYFEFNIPYPEIEKLCSTPLIGVLIIKVSIIDEASRIESVAFVPTKFFVFPFKVVFSSSNPTSFKPGLTYIGYVKVIQQDGRPLPAYDEDIVVKATASSVAPPFFEKSYPINADGIVRFEITIPPDIITLTINALLIKSKIGAVSKIENIQQSNTNSFLALSLLTFEPKAGEVAEFEARATDPIFEIFYIVLSRGTITFTGNVVIGERNIVSFYVALTTDMAPLARLVAFYIKDRELIVDALNFKVTGIFRNQVDATFTKPVVPPHTEADLVIHTNPDSLVCVLSLDKRVVIYSRAYDVTPYDVLLSLSQFDTTEGGFNVLENGEVSVTIGGRDTLTIIDQSGLQVFTDADIDFSRSSNMLPEGKCVGDCTFSPYVSQGGLTEELGYIRKFFPDTWIWKCLPTSPEGEVAIKEISPDYLTYWVTSVFSLHPEYGLGILPAPTLLRVFVPFFTFVKAPTFVILGEVVVIQVVVFFYGDVPLKSVLVEIRESPQFLHILKDGSTRPGIRKGLIPAIRPGGSGVILFPIKPIVLGSIELIIDSQSIPYSDSSIKVFEVRAGGLPVTVTDTLFIDLKQFIPCGRKETLVFSQVYPLLFPPGVIPGSLNIDVAVTGDILGPVITGLTDDKFLQFLPTGCAEQNLIYFGPLIYTYKYLLATQQLEDSFRLKAIINMQKGYVVELSFQRPDGSFATFPLIVLPPTLPPIPALPPTLHNAPSTWLTAFVVKLFKQATPFIYIDQKVIIGAINWLTTKQGPSGEFLEDGALLLDSIQGVDIKNVYSLTAFVVIALIENKDFSKEIPIITAVISKSLLFLESNLPTLFEDPYKLSITCYALTLAKSSKAPFCADTIYKMAVKDDIYIHWTYLDNGRLSVETTAYNLLTHLLLNRISDATKIARWLVVQQGGYGGFYSTQDTIIALQALALFSELTFCPDPIYRVKIKFGDKIFPFTINRINAILYQTVSLPIGDIIPKEIFIDAAGQGVGLVQVTSNYHLDEKAIGSFKGKASSKSKEEVLSVKPKVVTITGKSKEEVTDKPKIETFTGKSKEEVTDKPRVETSIGKSKGEAIGKSKGEVISKPTLNSTMVDNSSTFSPIILRIDNGSAIKSNLTFITALSKANVDQGKQHFSLLIITLASSEILGVKACTKWNLDKPSDSGFTMLEMGVPTGFKPDVGSVSLIDSLASVKEDKDKLVFYLNGVTGSQICLEYKLKRIDLVGNQKPVPCKIYQYYNPDTVVTKFLDAVTERLKTVCDLCKAGCVNSCPAFDISANSTKY
ncbi:unnamed protein product [Gordionus sp. m RMFG-2023]|uniref:CD109 antigen-like n=1 Tax=Gordionus sp. m RMFG-2023 TaxID=3053472 RepID=UPI0030E41444